jgi:hypothetical protein
MMLLLKFDGQFASGSQTYGGERHATVHLVGGVLAAPMSQVHATNDVPVIHMTPPLKLSVFVTFESNSEGVFGLWMCWIS